MAALSQSVSASGYSTLAPHPGAARKEAMPTASGTEPSQARAGGAVDTRRGGARVER
jgi:hypothetical protein